MASSNPSCVTYPTGRLSAWPASVLFRSWRMLECKFTTQDQRCPWVSASSNNRLGSSIWAAIISARYCFVYLGRGWRLFYISPGGESSSSKRGSDVVLRTMSNAELADRILSPISRGCDLPMVSLLPQLEELRFGGNVGFVNRRGEIFPRSNILGISPVSWGYIKRPRIVRGTYSIGRLGSCSSYSPPSRGMGFQKLSLRIL